MKLFFASLFSFISSFCFSQLQWQNVDSAYGPLPNGVNVYFTSQAIDTAPFRAFYLIADLKNKKLDFTTDTTLNRRLTPSQLYIKNNQPLVIVNGTFFSFETNRNLNVVVKDGKLLSRNPTYFKGKGKDSVNKYYAFRSAIGITTKRQADVAWLYTGFDSAAFSMQAPMANQYPVLPFNINGNGKLLSMRSGVPIVYSRRFDTSLFTAPIIKSSTGAKWKMQTAIGGGPVLVQNGKIMITNEEENMFTGQAINDKLPRTAMGYTKDNKLIILVVEGRNKYAGGATLTQEAQILKDLGCMEALNLDGGGSSCLLVNGKETINVSDPTGQRPVPAVFIIQTKK